MFKGGYKIIDFNHAELFGTGQNARVPGIHEAIESSYDKPLLIANLTLSGVEQNAVFAFPSITEDGFEFTQIPGWRIVVNSDDFIFSYRV